MLSFFKKKKNTEEAFQKQGSESTVSSKDLLNEEDSEVVEDVVETVLSIHPDWNLPEEEKYVYRFLNNDLEPLKPNQISLSGIELAKEKGTVRVTAFVRNSLKKEITFQPTPLLLISESGDVYAKKEFHLEALGAIPAESSRPWTFIFEEKDLKVDVDSISTMNWKLAFELKKKPTEHMLDLEESWEKSLAVEDKQKLESMVKNIQPPKPGEVNFMGLQATLREQNLHVTMLVRNGSEKNINLEQLPLIVEDASGDVIAQGGFQLEKFEVKANTSKPWTFIFPESLITKDIAEIDLSRWKAYPPQK